MSRRDQERLQDIRAAADAIAPLEEMTRQAEGLGLYDG